MSYKPDKYEKVIKILQKFPAFKEFSSSELRTLLAYWQPQIKTVPKNTVILPAGERPDMWGILLSGSIHVVNDDSDGNHTLVKALASGSSFGGAYYYTERDENPFTLVAVKDSLIMTWKTNPDGYPFPFQNFPMSMYKKFIGVLLRLIAKRDFDVYRRVHVLSLKTIREKVLAYLRDLSNHGRTVDIPLNQTQLACYLCVSRSALAHELSHMKKDGLIKYKKNIFTLKIR